MSPTRHPTTAARVAQSETDLMLKDVQEALRLSIGEPRHIVVKDQPASVPPRTAQTRAAGRPAVDPPPPRYDYTAPQYRKSLVLAVAAVCGVMVTGAGWWFAASPRAGSRSKPPSRPVATRSGPAVAKDPAAPVAMATNGSAALRSPSAGDTTSPTPQAVR